MSHDRSSHDPRRYRDRATGLVYRVLNDRGPHGGPDLAPVIGGAAREVALDELDRDYTRCDVIERGAPVCSTCGGEKFTVPGQRANLGWLCFHCHPRERAAAEAPYPEAPVAPPPTLPTAPAPPAVIVSVVEPPAVKPSVFEARSITIRPGIPHTPCVLRAWVWATAISARYFGLPVYLVGGALTDPDPRDIDLVVPVPDELFLAMYNNGRAADLTAWSSGLTDADPSPMWRRWARDCAKQSCIATMRAGRTVDFKTQPVTYFDTYSALARVRLDCAFMPEETPAP